jgi:hypothetical protein
MTVAEIQIPGMLRDGTQVFVKQSADEIARKLKGPLETMERGMRRLKGADGLVLKKRFLEAETAWEKFYWARIAEHLIGAKMPLEESMRLADEDLLMLSSAFTPL